MKAIVIFFMLGMSMSYSQEFIGQIFPIDSAGKYALINTKGDQISEWKRYDNVRTKVGIPFLLTEKYGKLGLADTNLNQQLTHRFKAIEPYGKYILAETHTALLFLNQQLDTVLEINDVSRYEIIHQNKKSRYYKASNGVTHKMIVHTYDGCGILKPSLEWQIEPSALDDAFYQDQIIYTRKGDSFGFISSNETIIPAIYATISSFNENVMELQDASGHRHYFTNQGKAFPHTDSTLVYDYLYGYYKIYQNGKGEIYNLQVEKILNHRFEDAFQINSPFKYHGVWVDAKPNDFTYQFAFLQNGKIGACNEKGQVLIPAQYEHIDAAMKDRYIIMKDGKFGVIDHNNNVVIEPTFTYIQYYVDYFRVVDGTKKGIMSLNGDTLVPIEFKEVNIEREGFLTLKKGKKGFYTFSGEKILDNVYDDAFHRNGGLELVASKGKCMLDKKGLLTPAYCSNISRTSKRVKYYYQGKIHLGEIVDHAVVNTTIYPMPKSTTITDRWQSNTAISFYQTPCVTFVDQRNGKYGSKKVKDTTWAIAPRFTNYFSMNYGKVKEPFEDYVHLGGNSFKTKEKIRSFDGENGHLGQNKLSHQDRMSSRTWHSSDFDPELLMDGTYEYYSNNHVNPGEQVFIFKRKGFNSVALTNGALTMQEGEDLISFRDFYFDLNDCHNFKIHSKRLFSQLSADPMVKVQDPNYRVQMIEENHTYRKLGDFKSYRELNSGAFMVQYQDESWNIILKGKEPLISSNVDEIKVVRFDEFEYYIAEQIMDNGQRLTFIYNGGGAMLDGKGFQSIKVVDVGLFKVENPTNYQWLDRYSNVVYEITKAETP